MSTSVTHRPSGPPPHRGRRSANRLIRVLLPVVVLALVTAVLTGLRDRVTLASDASLYLLVVVLTSLLGGFWPAIITGGSAALLLNYFFTAPLHSLAVVNTQSVVDLLVFLVVAVLVSRVVDLAAHRSTMVSRVSERAATLSMYDRQRTALLTAVGHDLRSPLARAKAATSSLRAEDVDWSDADRREFLAVADTAVDELTDLVTDLLDLSRLQVGAVAVLIGTVGLDDVVAGALEHVPRSESVEIDLPENLPAVSADGALLERVVANLIQNALRYTPTDLPVLVRGDADADRVRLRVIDHGPGVPAEARERIFAPFQRLDDVPVNGAGAGLGLAIARGFTEAMGGAVSLDTTPGGGATFVITLNRALDGDQL